MMFGERRRWWMLSRLRYRKRALILILYRCFGFGTPARERDKPKAG
jgi:hypothetical protein